MAKKQRFPHLLGSKWTSLQSTWGWRHFQVVNRKNEQGWVFAELVASCDPTVRFWLNANALKDRHLWQAGWKTREAMQQMQPPVDPLTDDLPDLEEAGMLQQDVTL
ncbi:MAG TPA: TIGR02450 family Trp-rich protein [Candidatus Obscuribacterales bacterium]